MGKTDKDIFDPNKELNLRINFDYPIGFRPFPKQVLKDITPKALIKEGFKRVSKSEYKKNFSGVLELSIEISRRRGKSFNWEMKEDNFKEMIQNFKAIKISLNKKARDIVGLMEKIRDPNIENTQSSKLHKEIMTKMFTETNDVQKMREAFFGKYHEFFEINSDFLIKCAYKRSRVFFFDACKTLRQLHLYFQFIELALDVPGFIKKSKRLTRKITPKIIKSSILGYQYCLAELKKIRRIWSDIGFDFQEIKKQYPGISEEVLEMITEERERGFKYKASDLALEFISSSAGTTKENLKKILKQEKEFAQEARKIIQKIENGNLTVETIGDVMGVPIIWRKSILKAEAPLSQDRFEMIKYCLFHFDPFDDKSTNSFLRDL